MSKMTFAHEGDNGFWVVTVEEGVRYLGYASVSAFLSGHGHPAGATGYLVGRWTGLKTDTIYPTLEAAIAAESEIPDRTSPRGEGYGNALGEHLGRLDAGD